MTGVHKAILYSMVAICIGILILVMWALPARAQTVCFQHDRLARVLEEKFGEQRIGFGLAKDEMVEVYISKAGTYTMVSTDPNHVSCIFAAGDSWQTETPPVLGDKT
ncbi:MAG: hypothetical protein ABJA10_07505 [Aestuariivirga sp.]